MIRATDTKPGEMSTRGTIAGAIAESAVLVGEARKNQDEGLSITAVVVVMLGVAVVVAGMIKAGTATAMIAGRRASFRFIALHAVSC